jgi:Ca2+-binding EF-hand superfamily protein
LNPFLLIPVAVALTYIAARVILTFRRTQRLHKVEAAAALFDDIDRGRSAIITVAELRAGLTSLGLYLTEDAVRKIVDSIAPNDDDQLTKDEFVACKYSRACIR